MIDKTKNLLAQANIGKALNAREYSPLALAYIGDAVYEVMIRTVVIGIGNARVNQYHQTTKEFVQAKGQAAFYNHIKEILTEAEEDIFDSDLDDLEDFVPVEKEEAKPSSQTKVRRGYIPLKFHSHDEAEEA